MKNKTIVDERKKSREARKKEVNALIKIANGLTKAQLERKAEEANRERARKLKASSGTREIGTSKVKGGKGK